jgi:hypothetical protein
MSPDVTGCHLGGDDLNGFLQKQTQSKPSNLRQKDSPCDVNAVLRLSGAIVGDETNPLRMIGRAGMSGQTRLVRTSRLRYFPALLIGKAA